MINDIKSIEEFKKINYRGLNITVGNFGTIIIDNKEIKQRLSPDGYKIFGWKINDKWTTIRVHRLVAIAFIPNPYNLEEVNHKDFNRANPRWDNLEWMSHNDNVKYSKEAGHYVGKFGKDNPNYGNHKLSTIYKNNKELSKEKQSRPGARNGRAKAVDLYVDDEYINRFNYIGELCKYIKKEYDLDTSIDGIRAGLRKASNNNRKYKGRFSVDYLAS